MPTTARFGRGAIVNDSPLNAERLEKLLADQSLFGLTGEEHNELNRLLGSSSVDPESFERIAAIISLTFQQPPMELLPDDLKRKILEASTAYISVATTSESSSDAITALSSAFKSNIEKMIPRVSRRREMLAWFIALASILVIAIGRWDSQPVSQPQRSLAELRANLLQGGSDVVQANWMETDDPSARGVAGDVVWSTGLQQGFLRFRGLAKNDPQHSQYQLWIYDTKRDNEFPVDGGVFDVDSSSGDVIVRISAKLRIFDPTAFAVTLERPGGVVVSRRARLLLIAKPGAKIVSSIDPLKRSNEA